MILTLCGSARFEPIWHEVNKQLGLSGHICFGLMTYPSIEGTKSWYTEEEKTMLDLMHLAKIDESDGVVMLNLGDYLGESSKRELAWARYKGKKVIWLEDGPRCNQRDDFLQTYLTLGRMASVVAVRFQLLRDQKEADAPI